MPRVTSAHGRPHGPKHLEYNCYCEGMDRSQNLSKDYAEVNIQTDDKEAETDENRRQCPTSILLFRHISHTILQDIPLEITCRYKQTELRK